MPLSSDRRLAPEATALTSASNDRSSIAKPSCTSQGWSQQPPVGAQCRFVLSSVRLAALYQSDYVASR
jgi:hypothetical protein